MLKHGNKASVNVPIYCVHLSFYNISSLCAHRTVSIFLSFAAASSLKYAITPGCVRTSLHTNVYLVLSLVSGLLLCAYADIGCELW